MRAKIMLLFLLSSCQVFPQISISLFGGINPPTNIIAKNVSNFLDSYWKSGLAVGVSGEMFLSSSLTISTSVEYSYYKFNNYIDRGFRIPEISFKSAMGNGSNVWKLFAEINFFPNPTRAVRSYVATGFGYVIEQIGIIDAVFEEQNWTDFRFLVTRRIQFEEKNFLAHTLGLGIRWDTFSNIAFDTKAQIFTNYKDRMYTTIKLGVLYSFIEE